MSALGRSPVDIDELIRTTGLGARDVHIVLLELTSPAGCKAMGSSSSRLSIPARLLLLGFFDGDTD